MERGELRGVCLERVGRVVNQTWRLDALIGVGGMAAVYAASKLDFSVAAIKILHPDINSNEDVRARFLREAYIGKTINHQGTVEIFEDGVDEDGSLFLVMELLVGQSVFARFREQDGLLCIPEALSIAEQTLAVLELSHSVDILHRDLKPENLYVVEGGRIKVLDFGIARLREHNVAQTQTGVVMGTPAYMAPEQALARWSQVDARTDLWAVGATLFHLISGRTVHEADTGAEMLVAAATNPIPSLARVCEAPAALVALVDRALQREPDQRFPNATVMRKSVNCLMTALEQGHALPARTRQKPPGDADATWIYRGVATERARPRESQRLGSKRRAADAVIAQLDLEQSQFAGAENVEALRRIFALLQRALAAARTYGDGHTETRRLFESTFREVSDTLEANTDALIWQVNPYSFHVGEHSVWEPEAPLDRVPYQLYSDGLRVMGLLQGIDQREFGELVRILQIDPVTEMAPDDDYFTLFWDASLDHVVSHAVDSFAEGDQDQRRNYEAERQRVIARAQDTADAVALNSTVSARNTVCPAAQTVQAVLDALDTCLASDPEAAARAAMLLRSDEGGGRRRHDPLLQLQLDGQSRVALEARLNADAHATDERFAMVAAHGLTKAHHDGLIERVSAPLQRAVEGLAQQEPADAIELVLSVERALSAIPCVAEDDTTRRAIVSELVSANALNGVLSGSTLDGDESAPAMAVSRLLSRLDGRFLSLVVGHIGVTQDALRGSLLRYVDSRSPGQEPLLGELAAALSTEVNTAIELVALLATRACSAAQQALSIALTSPHPLVRIAALSHLRDASDDGITCELRTLLEDENPQVRLNALQSLEHHRIGAVGPFLVLRIRSRSFDRLPLEERTQAIQTLCTLWPVRAEELCQAPAGRVPFAAVGASRGHPGAGGPCAGACGEPPPIPGAAQERDAEHVLEKQPTREACGAGGVWNHRGSRRQPEPHAGRTLADAFYRNLGGRPAYGRPGPDSVEVEEVIGATDPEDGLFGRLSGEHEIRPGARADSRKRVRGCVGRLQAGQKRRHSCRRQ